MEIDTSTVPESDSMLSESDLSGFDTFPTTDTSDSSEPLVPPLESQDEGFSDGDSNVDSDFAGFGDDSLYLSDGIDSPSDISSPVVVIQQAPQAAEESWTLDGIETYALSPVQSSSGLKGVLLDIIGPYDNIITQYRYQANSSSNFSYVHETTPDYPWIASALLFIILVHSVFSFFRRLLWTQ